MDYNKYLTNQKFENNDSSLATLAYNNGEKSQSVLLNNGNDTFKITEGKLTSGALSGYPYFTMGTYSSKAVNWVIIGKSTTISSSHYSIYYEKLSDLQTSKNDSASYKYFLIISWKQLKF